MDKNKEDWTSSPDARYVYHRILCALSRTSHEIFGNDWKRTGKLQPSLIASWWTAAIEALGCLFNLTVQIKLTTKSVLKSDSKGLKVGGKTLTFDIVGNSTKTKTGRFIEGKIRRLPFATKICVAKQFSTKYQSYLELQVSGNILGVKKWDHFVTEFRGIIDVLMKFTSPLVVIPFPDGPDSHKGRPFMHDPSGLVSTWKAKIYVNDLYITPGKPTKVKVFVGHNAPAAIFNSIQLAKRADEIDCSVKVCPIQSNKVVTAGYLNRSTKSLDPEHFTDLLNTIPRPRLKNLDVEVQIINIPDPAVDDTKKFNPKDQVYAAHVLCAKKNEDTVNVALANTYCKVRKASQAAGEYPEGRNMRYVPFKLTDNIAHTPKRFRKLQKSRMMHKWYQARQHSILFTGFTNVYQVLIVPNGDHITLCQVVMPIKCKYDYSSPVFQAVDVSLNGDVVIVCDINMRSEAEALLSYFGIYLALIFGSVVWEAFALEYKLKMNVFQFCPLQQCAVEIDNSTIDSTESTDLDFVRCGFTDNLLILPKVVTLDPKTNSLSMYVQMSMEPSATKTETLEPSGLTARMPPLEHSKLLSRSLSITYFHVQQPPPFHQQHQQQLPTITTPARTMPQCRNRLQQQLQSKQP